MRGVIWIVLLFAVAVVAATTLGTNDGLVTLYWRGWRTDFSLNLFLIIVAAACFVLVLAAQALRSLVSLPRRAGEWRALRRERAAQSALRESLAEYFGARFGRARKAAQKALAVAEEAPVLAADAEEATRLLGAEWALEDRDAPQALDLLAALPPGAARRTHALRLRLKAARMARQPLEALQTARLLAKHQAFSPLVAQSLLRSLAADTLEGAHDVQQLKRLWGQVDAADRRDAQVAARAALRAVQLDAADEARLWLRPFWDRLSELSRE